MQLSTAASSDVGSEASSGVGNEVSSGVGSEALLVRALWVTVDSTSHCKV